MFNKDATDNSTYNVENFEFIKKTSPVVGELIEKNTTGRRIISS